MAGGWTRDGAVQDQIDDSVTDAVLRARALMPHGDSAEECDDCGETIPKSAAMLCRGTTLRPLSPRPASSSIEHQPPRQQGQPAALKKALPPRWGRLVGGDCSS